MAERRMFAKTIIDSDAFLDMPVSAQVLYFHLSMRADDDGFINNPKKIQRMVGCGDDDLKLLIVKNFIIPFESGVVVIKHWRIHNFIRTDRYKATVYQEEKAMLNTKDNKAYTVKNSVGMTLGIPNDNQMDTQVRLGKDSIELGKDSIDDNMSVKPTTRKRFVPPTLEEVQAYCLERNNNVDAERFINYYTANGWVVGKGNKMKDWKAAVRNWEKSGYNSNTNTSKKSNSEEAYEFYEIAKQIEEGE